MDSMLHFETGADFLPLPVSNEAFQSDVDHDVIADGAPGRNQSGQRNWPTDSCRALTPASGDTDAYGLVNAEGTVRQRHPIAPNGFLHVCRPLTDWACWQGIIHPYQNSGGVEQLFSIVVLHRTNLLSQNRKRFERERAVFFTPWRLKMSST
jgi:hypothetical protein